MIVAATTRHQARAYEWSAANEAGYVTPYTDVRAVRSPEFDVLAVGKDKPVSIGWDDGIERFGCLAPPAL